MKFNTILDNIISKVSLFAFAIGVIISLTGISTAIAAESPKVEKVEKKLDTDITAINKMGSREEGRTAVVERLEKEFKVTDAQITSLRDQKLGYGEISTVFALAQKMGGINDTNLSKIMALRQGTPVMGWGEVAGKLGLKLGPVVSSVHKVETSSHREIAKMERTEHGASTMKNESHGGMGGMQHAGGHAR